MSTRIGGVAEVIESGLRLPLSDYISNATATSTTDVFQFYLGGSGGILQATVTVVYTDTTKSAIVSVTRVPPLT